MTSLDKQPIPEAPQDNLWTFVYKEGPAPKQACVKAGNEDQAYRIAVKWCEVQGFRPPAKVFPFIVADASILNAAVAPEVAVSEPTLTSRVMQRLTAPIG